MPRACRIVPVVVASFALAACSVSVDTDGRAGPTATVTATATATATTTATADPTASSSPSPRAAPTTRVVVTRGTFAVGQTAHTPNFDVTVLEHRRDGAIWGARVRTCYVRAHAGANADGTTRVSTDPWEYGGLSRDVGIVYDRTPADGGAAYDGWAPAYREARLRVGQCHEGWVAVVLVEAATGYSGMRYRPRDFDVDVRWEWEA